MGPSDDSLDTATGDPIPAKDGSVAPPNRLTLSDAEPGQPVRVARVRDDDPALLRYLAELGIVPEAMVIVAERAPFDGPIHVLVGEHDHALGRSVTDKVFVVQP